MSKRAGPPKHQNTYAWKPNLGRKINETEPGGRFRPLSEITGVCQRCRDQIDWKRKYGKYKPIVEPAKCQKCSKRNVRQAYHNVCTGCSKELGICAKCCTSVKQLVGRDAEEANSERKELEEAIRYARERERRTLLRLPSSNPTARREAHSSGARHGGGHGGRCYGWRGGGRPWWGGGGRQAVKDGRGGAVQGKSQRPKVRWWQGHSGDQERLLLAFSRCRLDDHVVRARLAEPASPGRGALPK
ncbi:hypothetical protein ACQJBY_028058 [Aegilops geniculata]